MRLATFFTHDGDTRVGAIAPDNRIVDLRRVYAALLAAVHIPVDLLAFIREGEAGWEAAREVLRHAREQMRRYGGPMGPAGERLDYALGEMRLRAQFQPMTIICAGANFTDHLEETKRITPEHVEFLLKSPLGIIGPEDPILYQPSLTRKPHYQVELAIIIGRPCRHIPRDRAYDHMFGCSTFNDVSARDPQVIYWEGSWFILHFGEGKCFDTSGPFDPWIVTREELGEASNLPMHTWADEDLWQDNNTRNLVWEIPELINHYSSFITLEPGILVCNGTPGGPGLGRDEALGGQLYLREDIVHGGYLQPADVVRCEIEGIGVLRNPVWEEGSAA